MVSITPYPQDNSRATLSPILQREDGRIDFSHSAAEILNRLRGFQPWPGAFTSFRGRKLEITAAQAANEGNLAEGELRYSDGRILVGCGQRSTLEILQVQPEGRSASPHATSPTARALLPMTRSAKLFAGSAKRSCDCCLSSSRCRF